MKLKLFLVSLALLLSFSVAFAQEDTLTVDPMPPDSALLPAPVTNLSAIDSENDHGHSITLNWDVSVDDGAGVNSVTLYEVFRWVPDQMSRLTELRDTLSFLRSRTSDRWRLPEPGSRTAAIMAVFSGWSEEQFEEKLDAMREQYDDDIAALPEAHATYPNNGSWVSVGLVPSGASTFDDKGMKETDNAGYLPDFCDFYYRIDAVTADSRIRTSSDVVGPVQSSGQWFHLGKLGVLIFVVSFGFLTVFFVYRARRGADLFVRPMAGIEAVDDAIGRATEMGRPILYVMGLGYAEQVATIASFTILGRVAKRVAEYQTQLIVPAYDAVVMAVAQEVVKTAYYDAGRADDYDEDIVHFVTNMQFAYVAAVNGIMLRELPATNVYMGKFFAESLMMAETGAVAGSIQIAGTDEIAQIPFFIVACDYTLIGEELYAASAYLGREPVLLGSLKAQDYAKAVVILLAIAGMVAANFGAEWFTNLFSVVD